MQNFAFVVQHPWGTWLAVIMAESPTAAMESARILYGTRADIDALTEEEFSARAKAGGLDVFIN